jgi:hypothetical protein
LIFDSRSRSGQEIAEGGRFFRCDRLGNALLLYDWITELKPIGGILNRQGAKDMQSAMTKPECRIANFKL